VKRVTGIGGIFFKCKDPDTVQKWYQEHLGITPKGDGYVIFEWREADDPERKGVTVWSPFKQDTSYFDPSKSEFMVNYRVEDLHGLLAALRQEGVEVDDKVDESEFGKFGWIMDPEGRRIELWEPPETEPGAGSGDETDEKSAE